jgi:hypothetical protein
MSRNGVIVHLLFSGDSLEGLSGYPAHCDFQRVGVWISWLTGSMRREESRAENPHHCKTRKEGAPGDAENSRISSMEFSEVGEVPFGDYLFSRH